MYHVATIKEFFEHKTFGEISPMDVERFKRQRRQGLTKKGTQRSPASVNRELACLSRIFSSAIRDGFAASNPCAQVKKLRENNKRQRYLDAEEETRLFAACTGQRAHLKPILMIALQTGMRKGEILSLRWSQIDFARGVIHLPDPKSDKEEEVTINERVREELLELRVESEGSEFVFRSPKTGRALTDVKRAFKAACLEAGISGLCFHDTRHTTGTRLAATGTDPVTIASILRHADLRMTARYTHAIAERKRQALERISTFAERAAERQKNVKTDERRKA